MLYKLLVKFFYYLGFVQLSKEELERMDNPFPPKMFSFCESQWASSRSKWHIRYCEHGRKLGGGIDSNSLCGHVKKGGGWDLEVEICERTLYSGVCPECKRIYKRLLTEKI